MNIKKIITIGLSVIVAGMFVVLLLKELTGHSHSSNSLDTPNSSDTSMYNKPDTSAYQNYPADYYNAAGAHVATTYPNNHYNTRNHYRTRKRSVSYHRSYSGRSSYAARNATVRRRGWSSAAKGTAIGAGSGAVLGAIVAGDHHRAGGAVIGGVIGAAGGYLYGRHRDKKHKRY